MYDIVCTNNTIVTLTGRGREETEEDEGELCNLWSFGINLTTVTPDVEC